MKTKITCVILILITAISGQLYGQRNPKAKERLKERKEQLDADRIVFYNNFLSLTSVEAEKFWPLHKEYHQKIKELKQSHAKKNKTLRSKSTSELSKEESAELMKSQFEHKQSLLDLEKEYTLKYQTALPIQKVVKLKEAEVEFKKDFLKKAKEKKRLKMEERKNKK